MGGAHLGAGSCMERARGGCNPVGRGCGGVSGSPRASQSPRGPGREQSCSDPTHCRMRRGKARGGRGTPQPSCGNPARGFLGWGHGGAAWMSAARESPTRPGRLRGFRAPAASCKHVRGRGRRARGLAPPVLPVPAGLQEFGLCPCSPGLVAKRRPASTQTSRAGTSPRPRGAGPAAPCGRIQLQWGAWWAQGGAGLRVPTGSSVPVRAEGVQCVWGGARSWGSACQQGWGHLVCAGSPPVCVHCGTWVRVLERTDACACRDMCAPLCAGVGACVRVCMHTGMWVYLCVYRGHGTRVRVHRGEGGRACRDSCVCVGLHRACACGVAAWPCPCVCVAPCRWRRKVRGAQAGLQGQCRCCRVPMCRQCRCVRGGIPTTVPGCPQPRGVRSAPLPPHPAACSCGAGGWVGAGPGADGEGAADG